MPDYGLLRAQNSQAVSSGLRPRKRQKLSVLILIRLIASQFLKHAFWKLLRFWAAMPANKLLASAHSRRHALSMATTSKRVPVGMRIVQQRVNREFVRQGTDAKLYVSASHAQREIFGRWFLIETGEPKKVDLEKLARKMKQLENWEVIGDE